jgi:hypothetical protein
LELAPEYRKILPLLRRLLADLGFGVTELWA